jgi:CBS domain-containing protein
VEGFNLIPSNVVFVPDDMHIRDVVALMTEKHISSVLVVDHEEKLVGIVTERDIVHKFTLLDMKDKLERRVNTIMTRPVVTVPLEASWDDMVKLHLDKRIRHFPVVKDRAVHRDSVVGIISASDLLRHAYAKATKAPRPIEKGHAPVIAILCAHKPQAELYGKLFEKVGFEPHVIGDIHHFLKDATATHQTLLFDMDGFAELVLRDLIVLTKKFPGQLIMATSNPVALPTFRKYLDNERQEIALKPINVSYCQWLVTKKWAAEKTRS